MTPNISIRVFNINFNSPVFYDGEEVKEETFDFFEFDDDGEPNEDYELLIEEGVEEYFTTLFIEDFGVGVESFDYEYLVK